MATLSLIYSTLILYMPADASEDQVVVVCMLRRAHFWGGAQPLWPRVSHRFYGKACTARCRYSTEKSTQKNKSFPSAAGYEEKTSSNSREQYDDLQVMRLIFVAHL